MIKSLYRDYFQKSRVFLYPVLETKKSESTTPIDTFISWDNNISPEDMKLICTFYLRNDDDFRKFEKIKLVGNPLFHDFKEGENGVGIYIFDFKQFAADWEMFLKGKYSKLSPTVKERIRRHYGTNTANGVYVDSFLDPKKYYPIYADLLNVHISALEGGELCDLPNVEKELLKMSVKEIGVSDKSLDLPNS